MSSPVSKASKFVELFVTSSGPFTVIIILEYYVPLNSSTPVILVNYSSLCSRSFLSVKVVCCLVLQHPPVTLVPAGGVRSAGDHLAFLSLGQLLGATLTSKLRHGKNPTLHGHPSTATGGRAWCPI